MFQLLNELGFSYEDLSKRLLKDRFELNWWERIASSLLGAHRVTGLLLVCRRKAN